MVSSQRDSNSQSSERKSHYLSLHKKTFWCTGPSGFHTGYFTSPNQFYRPELFFYNKGCKKVASNINWLQYRLSPFFACISFWESSIWVPIQDHKINLLAIEVRLKLLKLKVSCIAGACKMLKGPSDLQVTNFHKPEPISASCMFYEGSQTDSYCILTLDKRWSLNLSNHSYTAGKPLPLLPNVDFFPWNKSYV